jgi:hypothetical protein
MHKRTLKASTRTGKVERAKIRSAIRALHVMPKRGEGWVVSKIGDGRVTQRFSSKQDAIEFAKSIVKSPKTNLIIHDRDGTIQTA